MYMLADAILALFIYFFFFFQAEDGIRDADVTGVQTCALPISPVTRVVASRSLAQRPPSTCQEIAVSTGAWTSTVTKATPARSEERRVGKECRSWWSPEH